MEKNKKLEKLGAKDDTNEEIIDTRTKKTEN